MDWKKRLLEDGFIEVGQFRVELTLDQTFMDLEYLPRIAVYDEVTGAWYVLRNPIPKGDTLDESWKNAVEVLESVCRQENADLGDRNVSRRFIEALKSLCL